MKFNQSQQKAISHNKGPMLVLAGPGSGKTLVITRRTKELIEQYGVNPNKILVITFTKAAATEMRERFSTMMGGSTCGVQFGTFHAIFFTVLKYAYHYNASNILREEQKAQFYRELIPKLELDLEDEKEFIQGIEGEISLVKGDMISLEHYYSINCSEEVFRKIYNEYENFLRRHNLIDFDDMLVFTYELFKQRPDILKIWQKRFEYILIDEFQDINSLQYKIIQMLAKPEDNLFIVGDDDQSIYRFRGAKPEIMLNFEKDYINAKRVLLDVNYRSTKKIVTSALRVIKNNKKRFPKNINTINGDGNDLHLKVFDTVAKENQQILDEIINYRKAGYEFSDMAILYRTNTQPRMLLEKFMEYNVPFKMRDTIPNIYDHWIARNMIDYIKMALGNRDRNLFYQIMNRPKRYLSRDCATEQQVDFQRVMGYYSDRPWVMERIQKLQYDLKMIKDMNPFSAIYYIRKAVNYEEYLEEYAAYRRIKEEELLDVLNEVQEASKAFKNFDDWFAHIEEYGKELEEQANRNRNNASSEGVSFATMHSSKGLEYQIVFIIDANEEITPHHKAVLDEDMEEERRMFYVAMTRAKKELHIYSVKERYNKELEISRFVNEIYVDLDSLKKDAIVQHKTYGKGTVRSLKDGKVTIQFEKMAMPKTLNLDYCVKNQLLQIIDA